MLDFREGQGKWNSGTGGDGGDTPEGEI